VRNVRVTGLGVAMLAVFASALVLAIWGSGAVRDVGGFLVVFVISMLVAQAAADRAVRPPDDRL
jgi:hypothetical protein